MSLPRASSLILLVGILVVIGHASAQAQKLSEGPTTNREMMKPYLDARVPMTPEEEEAALQGMQRLWLQDLPVLKSHFLGVNTAQPPLDAWIFQEIMSEVKPDLIVEAGTYKGGSSALWAVLLEHINPDGRVITIDIEDQRTPRAKRLPIVKRRVDFLLGSSTDPEVVAEVTRRAEGKRVLVLLDSLHTGEHVAAELAAYSPLVPVGSYIVVQDTGLDAIPAIEAFVAEHPNWVIDRERERFRLTSTRKGYLRRTR